MRIPIFIVQLIVLICWYTVPDMADMPWWLAWAPTLFPLFCIVVVFITIVLFAFCEAYADSRRTIIYRWPRNAKR